MASRRFSAAPAITLLALFIAALVAYYRHAGDSPLVWMDTFNDENEVRECLYLGSCTLVGVSTSIPGLAHGVGWLELRTLLAWLGLGFEGTHTVILVLNAVAAVIVFQLASSLGGVLAGVASMWMFVVGIGSVAVRAGALHNMSLLPFLGATFLLTCTAAVDRPGLLSLTLAALVAAILANVHIACIVAGVSVVWVGMLAPPRFASALLVASVFVLAAWAVAAPSWESNLAAVLQHRTASGHRGSAVGVSLSPVVQLALFGVAAWIFSLGARNPAARAYRRRVQGALAIAVPFVAAFLLAPSAGIEANPKYLTYITSASIIAAVLPAALVADAVLRRVFPSRWLAVLGRALPLALALVMGSGVGDSLTADDGLTPTVGDLTAVSRILQHERGWSLPHLLDGVQTPYGLPLLAGLKQVAGSARDGVDEATSAVVMVLAESELPQPVPPNWRLLRRSSRAATVLVLLPSRIDWSSFEACSQADEGRPQACAESGWRFDDGGKFFNLPNLPAPGWHGTLRLKLPLRAAATAPGAVFMPRLPGGCAGRIVSVAQGGALDTDGRGATLPVSDTAASIELEWDIGSAHCPGSAYEGLPPFVIEGDAASVELLETILRKREA